MNGNLLARKITEVPGGLSHLPEIRQTPSVDSPLSATDIAAIYASKHRFYLPPKQELRAQSESTREWLVGHLGELTDG